MENIPYNAITYQQSEKLRRKTERKKFKLWIEHMSGGLLIYTMFLFAGVIGFEILQMIIIAITSGSREAYNEQIKKLEETATETAGGMIIGVIMGCIFMSLFFIKRLKITEIAAPHRKMKPFTLLTAMGAIMVCQFIFSYIIEFIEYGFNLVGLTTQEGIDSSTAGSTTISMMLYAGFVGPMAEELIYRGFVMHTIHKNGCGKICAILVSSLLFGVMHANLTQTIFTMFLGVVFAYIAMEYGLLWSFFLHVYNNFIIGDMVVYIDKNISETLATIINLVLIISGGITVLIALIVKRKKIFAYIRENRSPAKHYGWIFSTITTIVFIILNCLMMLLTIKRLDT